MYYGEKTRLGKRSVSEDVLELPFLEGAHKPSSASFTRIACIPFAGTNRRVGTPKNRNLPDRINLGGGRCWGIEIKRSNRRGRRFIHRYRKMRTRRKNFGIRWTGAQAPQVFEASSASDYRWSTMISGDKMTEHYYIRAKKAFSRPSIWGARVPASVGAELPTGALRPHELRVVFRENYTLSMSRRTESQLINYRARSAAAAVGARARRKNVIFAREKKKKYPPKS